MQHVLEHYLMHIMDGDVVVEYFVEQVLAYDENRLWFANIDCVVLYLYVFVPTQTIVLAGEGFNEEYDFFLQL